MANRFFVDAVAGAGKTYQLVRLAINRIQERKNVLILVFQKEDRVTIVQRLLSQGFEITSGDYKTGIIRLDRNKEEGIIYISNIHALAYSTFKEKKLIILDETEKNALEFWTKYMSKYPRAFSAYSEKIGDYLFILNQILKNYGCNSIEEILNSKAGQVSVFMLKLLLDIPETKKILELLDTFVADYEEAKKEFKIHKENELKELGTQKEVFITEYDDLIRQMTKPGITVDTIIIDEAQDWKPVWIDKILQLYPDKEIITLGDTNQAIYLSGGSFENYAKCMIQRKFNQLTIDELKVVKRSVKNAYDIALKYQLREKVHLYRKRGNPFFSTSLSDFLSQKGSKMILVRNRHHEYEWLKKLISANILVIPQRYRINWTIFKGLIKEAIKREIILHIDYIFPFLKDEELKKLKRKLKYPISIKEFLAYLIEKGSIESLIREEYLQFVEENDEPVIISTIHKAKGKESDFVYLDLRKSKKVKLLEEHYPEVELPVDYVARTRHKLGFVSPSLV